jgi:hypothetical protein
MKTKDKWIKIGEVGVDSGNLMVCDPCYIDSNWKKEEYVRDQRFRDTITKRIYAFGKDFDYFETKMKGYRGLTPNELIKSGRWVELPEKEVPGFSYNAVTHTGNKMHKQINYALGHAGLAVSFHSGLGDGTYNVMAKIGEVKGWGQRVKEIKIKLV